MLDEVGRREDEDLAHEVRILLVAAHCTRDGGRGQSVIQQRMEFQDLMRARFEGVIRDATGRRVIGFMSGNQQDPDIMCEVFILAPTDLVDHHELPSVAPGW